MLCESEQKHIYVEVYRVRVDSCLENGHSSGELVELATLVSFPFSFHLLFVDRLARDFLVFRNVIPRRWQRRWIFSRREYYRCINVSYQFKRCWSRGVASPFIPPLRSWNIFGKGTKIRKKLDQLFVVTVCAIRSPIFPRICTIFHLSGTRYRPA